MKLEKFYDLLFILLVGILTGVCIVCLVHIYMNSHNKIVHCIDHGGVKQISSTKYSTSILCNDDTMEW